MKDRLVLAIDTSFGPVGAALATFDGKIVASAEADNPPGRQAETLPPLVAEMFASAGVAFTQIDRVAVTVGPGAFTGVRVGLAFAKGIRLATGAAILGVTTLECLAAQAARSEPGRSIGVAIDAKRGELYAQAFDAAIEPLSTAAVLLTLDAADLFQRVLPEPVALTGSGATMVAETMDRETSIVDVRRIDTKLLAVRAARADPARHPATPAYLRAPDAKLPS
jgi:tRNA threonylcarbamoyladenosine biosynthesis protein TsaB